LVVAVVAGLVAQLVYALVVAVVAVEPDQWFKHTQLQ
jgi:hypothetical protein